MKTKYKERTLDSVRSHHSNRNNNKIVMYRRLLFIYIAHMHTHIMPICHYIAGVINFIRKLKNGYPIFNTFSYKQRFREALQMLVHCRRILQAKCVVTAVNLLPFFFPIFTSIHTHTL